MAAQVIHLGLYGHFGKAVAACAPGASVSRWWDYQTTNVLPDVTCRRCLSGEEFNRRLKAGQEGDRG